MRSSACGPCAQCPARARRRAGRARRTARAPCSRRPRPCSSTCRVLGRARVRVRRSGLGGQGHRHWWYPSAKSGGSGVTPAAALEAAGSSIRGSGRALSGPTSPWERRHRPEPPGAPRGGTGAELGRCLDCTLTMLLHRARRARPVGAGAALAGT
eukprot:scaffold56780_cov62-Phaeocystis_antarctica.AAC.1